MVLTQWFNLTMTSALLLSCLVGTPYSHAETPTLNPASDAQHLPQAGSSLLFWQGKQQIAGFRNLERLHPTRKIRAGGSLLSLPEALVNLGDVQFQYKGTVLTTDDYFAGQRIAGLLVIKMDA